MAKGVVNDAQKNSLLLQIQELYETLSYPGPREEFEEDTATDLEKTVRTCTLNAYFVNRSEKQLVN